MNVPPMNEAPRAPLPFRPAGDAEGIFLPVRVRPRASRGRIEGVVVAADGTRRLKVSVTAAPEGGKANRAVVALLAKAWKLPKTAFSIAAGSRARNKTVRITGAAPSILSGIGGAGGDRE